jgi:hypothetical protein
MKYIQMNSVVGHLSPDLCRYINQLSNIETSYQILPPMAVIEQPHAPVVQVLVKTI